MRRDNCLLVRQLIDRCLRTMLIDKDVQGAIAYAKGIISDLLQVKPARARCSCCESVGAPSFHVSRSQCFSASHSPPTNLTDMALDAEQT